MHMWSNEVGMLGGNGIVAAQLPIATGVALAAQYRGLDEIVMCFFGDGAVDEGAFHESLNLASLWKLPVIFVCENNQYSMGMAVEKAWAVDSLLPRAAAHNVPAYVVFHDATLADMARTRPDSLAALGQISGVGAKKLQAYGEELLRVLHGPIDHNESAPAP